MRKSSLRDYVMDSLRTTPQYIPVMISNPGLFTPLQFLREILRVLDGTALERHHRDLGQVQHQVQECMVTAYATRGARTVLWIDEADKLDISRLGLVRALADLRTPSGDKVCKLILKSTPRFTKKFEAMIETPTSTGAEADAFADRVGIQSFDMQPWSATDIRDWWAQIAAWVSISPTSYCPFDANVADRVHTLSSGKPRTVAQLSSLALRFAARSAQPIPPISLETMEKSLKSVRS